MYWEIEKNKLKSILLVIFFFGVTFSLLFLVFYTQTYDYEFSFYSSLFGIIFTFLYLLLKYLKSPKEILFSVEAKEISESSRYSYLNDIVEVLSVKARIPKPKVYIIPEKDFINAFATGTSPKKSSIALTLGCINKLNKEELEGVIAHELAHIKNYDTRLMLIISVFTTILIGLPRLFLDGGGKRSSRGNAKGGTLLLIVTVILVILAPLVGVIIHLAISRKREFLADVSAVEITRYPQGLVGALKKIEKYGSMVDTANERNAYMFFHNPLRSGFLKNLFSTHPPISERIKVLERIAI